MAISIVGAGGVANAVSGANIIVGVSSVAVQLNDIAFICYSVPRAFTMMVTSSSGALFTQIGETIANGNLNASCWYRKIDSNLGVNATCQGSCNAQDAITGVGFAFRNTDPYSSILTSNSTIGTSTTPDSPAVTATSSRDVVISAVAALIADTTVTAPSSFLNAISTAASDTRSCTTAGAWVIPGSTASFNPTSWSNFTSAAWVAFSVVLKSTSVFVPFNMIGSKDAYGDEVFRKYAVVSY